MNRLHLRCGTIRLSLWADSPSRHTPSTHPSHSSTCWDPAAGRVSRKQWERLWKVARFRISWTRSKGGEQKSESRSPSSILESLKVILVNWIHFLQIYYVRLTSRIWESLRKRPAAPFSVSVVIEQVIILALSSGAGWNTNSDVVVFPSEDVWEWRRLDQVILVDSFCNLSTSRN